MINNELLALERRTGSVVQVNPKRVVANAPNLNHGLSYGCGYLYASSPTTVYRWSFDESTLSVTGTVEEVITGLPTGGHTTRTLLVHHNCTYIYMSVGSGTNVDPNAARARVMRYRISMLPQTWEEGELFADGLRNTVALCLDEETGVLYGADNGVDDLHRDDLGGDIHATNPGEEINRFSTPGLFYGYPFCWSEGVLSSTPAKQRFETRVTDGKSDAWCQDKRNVVPPQMVLPAHVAPLGCEFISFGSQKSLFVAAHGSWNSPNPIGYKVYRIPLTNETGAYTSFFGYFGDYDPHLWPHRMVSVKKAKRNGTVGMFVSSDVSNTIFWIEKSDLISTPPSTKINNSINTAAMVLLILGSVFLLVLIVVSLLCFRQRKMEYAFETLQEESTMDSEVEPSEENHSKVL